MVAGVLSGNRNFEGRVHPNTRANYLASPPLVIAYALAGTVRIDFEREPLGVDSEGREVYLRDIWPSREEIQEVERTFVIPSMFQEIYQKIEVALPAAAAEGQATPTRETNRPVVPPQKVNESWNSLVAPSDTLYSWDPESTYIKPPPFFQGLVSRPFLKATPPAQRDRRLSPAQSMELRPPSSILDAHVLLNLGDSVTTDHISPAGNIARSSAAARYLTSRG